LSLGRHRIDWLTGGAHFVILSLAMQADSHAAWPYALIAMSIASFCAWVANYRRFRGVHDLPTSRIASAAQGYVELFGRSAMIADSPITAPCSQLPCCWWSFCVERKTSDDKWVQEDHGESVAHFLLKDETGECVISPEGAEVLYPRKSVWTQGERRFTEWLLLPVGPLYAIGEFTTAGGADLELNENRDVGELLADWKKDRAQLLSRFDRDRSGDVDLAEWEHARLEARREVQQRHSELRSTPGLHLLRKPADGRVFILAAALPGKIGRRFQVWSGVHLAFMFASGIAALVLLGSP
jgi:hypothetical protein